MRQGAFRATTAWWCCSVFTLISLIFEPNPTGAELLIEYPDH